MELQLQLSATEQGALVMEVSFIHSWRWSRNGEFLNKPGDSMQKVIVHYFWSLLSQGFAVQYKISNPLCEHPHTFKHLQNRIMTHFLYSLQNMKWIEFWAVLKCGEAHKRGCRLPTPSQGYQPLVTETLFSWQQSNHGMLSLPSLYSPMLSPLSGSLTSM